MGKRELIALLNLSSLCLVMVERLFLAVPRGCLQFVIVVFPDHTHYFFSRVHHEEQICEIILNLGECFRRRCRLNDCLSGAFEVLLFGAAEQLMQF